MKRRFSHKIPVNKINRNKADTNKNKVNIIRTRRNKVRIERPPVKNNFNKVNNKNIVKNIKSSNTKRHQPIRVKNKPNNIFYKKIQDIKDCGIDKILVMIACGPSVLECNFSALKDNSSVDIMVINKPLKQVWPPKYWAFCDHSQFLRNKDIFNSYPGIIINSSGVRARSKRNNQIIINAKHTTGISRNLHEGYVIGKSSVYANIQTALWMNYKEIYIFGVDMCQVGNKLHHYGKNPDIDENKRIKKFKTEAFNYENMANSLPKNIKDRIFFCSSYNKWDFINKFNRLDHIKAIDVILNKSKCI